MAAKFHERFDIEVGVEKARCRFVNRVHNLVFDSFWRELNEPHRSHAAREAVSALGDRFDDHPYERLGTQVGDDFYRNLQALEALHQALSLNYDRDRLRRLIQRIIDTSEVDLGVRWENGQFIRSGAELLDEALVNDPLRWLKSSGYETVQEPFEKGLSHFLHATKRPELLADVMTAMYESLEALARIVTKRPNADLSGNRELFIKEVKASDAYKQLLKGYVDYANRFRHAVRDGQTRPELSPKEVESFVYLTGVFIRLAMPSP